MKQIRFLGYEVSSFSKEEGLSHIKNIINRPDASCKYVTTINPHSYVVARSDHEFSLALQDAEMLIPDGIGITFGSLLLGNKIKSRCTGFDFFDMTMQILNEKSGRVFFLGASNETLQKIRIRVIRDFPNVSVSGTFSPPFKDNLDAEESKEIIHLINKTNPDVLFVGMTAPKQEKWIKNYIDQLDVKLAGAIGAVFDYYAGNKVRANIFFRVIGFEWFIRFVSEPRRLWRRSLISNPIFIWDIFSNVLQNLVNYENKKS